MLEEAVVFVYHLGSVLLAHLLNDGKGVIVQTLIEADIAHWHATCRFFFLTPSSPKTVLESPRRMCLLKLEIRKL